MPASMVRWAERYEAGAVRPSFFDFDFCILPAAVKAAAQADEARVEAVSRHFGAGGGVGSAMVAHAIHADHDAATVAAVLAVDIEWVQAGIVHHPDRAID